MGKLRFEDDKKGGFFKKGGLYISLAVCMLALGIGTWSAVNRLNPPDVKDNMSFTAPTTGEIKGAQKNQPSVKADITKQGTTKETAKQTTKVTTKAINSVAEFFVMPVGGTIFKNYSDTQLQYSETYNDWRIHLGVDIAADKGTEIRVSGDGKVKDVYEDALLGNTVVIDHGNGIIAYYSGINEPLVKKNQVVEVGTVLGGIGAIPCESVEQPHIHFAVKKEGKWASPFEALKIDIS